MQSVLEQTNKVITTSLHHIIDDNDCWIRMKTKCYLDGNKINLNIHCPVITKNITKDHVITGIVNIRMLQYKYRKYF